MGGTGSAESPAPKRQTHRNLPSSELFCIARHLDQPRQEATITDERLPLGQIPVLLTRARLLRTGLTTEEHHNRIGLGGNESQEKYVPRAAVVALENGFSEGAISMKGHLLMFGSHQMVDNMTEVVKE